MGKADPVHVGAADSERDQLGCLLVALWGTAILCLLVIWPVGLLLLVLALAVTVALGGTA